MMILCVLLRALVYKFDQLSHRCCRTKSSRDPVLLEVMRFTKEGWLSNISSSYPVGKCKKISDSLSTCYGCLLYGSRVVIPTALRSHVLQILHTGHFGFEG